MKYEERSALRWENIENEEKFKNKKTHTKKEG